MSSMQSYLNKMKEFVKIPVDLFNSFYKGLEPEIRMTITTIFIVLVIIGIICLIKR